MQTEEIIEVKTAVAVTEEALKLLCQRLEEEAAKEKPDILGKNVKGHVRCYGELNNGSKITFEDTKELLAYQNSRKRRIQMLMISLSLGGIFNDSGVSVTVSNAGRALRATSKGEIGEAVRLRHYLEDFAEAVRAPWRWMWWHTDNILLVLFFLCVSGSIVLMAVYVPSKPSAPPPPPGGEWKSAALGVLFPVAVIAFLFVLNRLRHWFFPRAIIAIGQEKVRFEQLKKWHWLVIGLLFTTVMGLVVRTYLW